MVMLNSVPGFVGCNMNIFVAHVGIIQTASGAAMSFTNRRTDIVGAQSKLKIEGTVQEIETARLGIAGSLSYTRSAHTDFSQFDRPDIESLQVPVARVGFVMGSHRSTLQKLEKATGTFIFFNNQAVNSQNEKTMYILGPPSGRRQALNHVNTMLVRDAMERTQRNPRYTASNAKSYRGGGGGGGGDFRNGNKNNGSSNINSNDRRGNFRDGGSGSNRHDYHHDRRSRSPPHRHRSRSRSNDARHRSRKRGRKRGRSRSGDREW